MSHFYGTIKGQAKTEATRRGSKKSGISAHVRAWNHGIKIYLTHDEITGLDHIEVFSTGGSHNPNTDVLLHREEIKG